MLAVIEHIFSLVIVACLCFFITITLVIIADKASSSCRGTHIDHSTHAYDSYGYAKRPS